MSVAAIPANPAAEPLPETASAPDARETESGAILTIDLDAITANWKALARRATPAECAAVVKADAYGCGLEAVGTALAKAGCKTFFVADLGEARRLRAVAPQATIYVLGGLLPGTGPTFADLNISPCIGSLVELAEWDAFVAQSGWRGQFALHVDAGRTPRAPTFPEPAPVAPRCPPERPGRAPRSRHCARAGRRAPAPSGGRTKLSRRFRRLPRATPASIANSSGIFLGALAHCDLVRPGYALYGGNPTPGRTNPMRAAIDLRGRILQVRDVAKGDSVGYGAAWSAPRSARIAIVSLGYGDGFPRAAGAADRATGTQAVVGGKLCPLAGRISMDLMAIDVSELPPGTAKRGDLATLIGDEIGIDDVGAAARSIGYEVLTNLGKRYHRVYRGG